jgi:tetratricopeptide (TPR) repeat protein
MAGQMARRWSVFVTVALVTTAIAVRGRAEAAAPSAPASADEPAPRERARELFEQGQAAYDLGEYDRAVALLREAYQLSSAPALLFNIAQAHRRARQCTRALEVYRHFVRVDPDSPYRADAEAHILALAARCGEDPAAAPAAPATPVPAPAVRLVEPATQPPPPPPKRGRSAVALLGSGAVLGLAAASVAIWNAGRHGEWGREDAWLAVPSGDPGQLHDRIRRQNANDALLQSIERYDRVSIASAVLSAVCLTGAVIGWKFGWP